MSVRDLYHDRESLTKWEAEEVFMEGLILKRVGGLDGFWQDSVSEKALEQFSQYSQITQECLFPGVYGFVMNEVKRRHEGKLLEKNTFK